MFKKVLFAAAIALICPTFVFAQDISFLFGGGQNLVDPAQAPPGLNVSPASSSQFLPASSVGTSGSVNIFSVSGFDFDAADIDFFSSDTSVAQITGGTVFNPSFNVIGDARFESDGIAVTADPGGGSGNLSAVNVLNNGVGSSAIEIFDPLFDSVDGNLLATIDFDIVGTGTTEFSFEADGGESVFGLPDILIFVSFGNATLVVEDVPEPSSAIVLILGSVAVFARRKRV